MRPSTRWSTLASGASCMAGSVRISSIKRPRPAVPLANSSAKVESFRTGLTKVVIYRLKVMRSTVSISPRMMNTPPAAMTATDRMHRKNSMVALNRPMALWNWRLEVLKLSLESSNFRSSACSLAKALAVRMPERPDSISALIVAVFCFTRREASCMEARHFQTTRKKIGRMTAMTRASRH